ncbi:ACP S-malonyltransferase [Azospirillum sp. B4]|uniref:ACP S-malonyltransferase n=1 Tax=Azospirillum sp. B4 TaxID=95605 RepID=UPI00034DA160|nr:ACP S-malonyltransferase [Azospirillum sp. B4]
MTRIFVFPGQGSQARGMGKDLFDSFRDMEREADEILGYSIRTLCLDDPDGNLVRTQYTQPALYVVGAMAYRRRVEQLGDTPEFVAGHSLGEYNALFAAEAFSFTDGLKLVRQRGALMGNASGGGMAAVVGEDITNIREMLAEAGETTIDLANHNSPRQSVLAGPKEALERVAPYLESRKGVRVVPLNVRTAFHSRYMAPTKAEFGAYIAGFKLSPLMLPVISNLTALPYRDDEIAHNLVQQIDHPVRWVESIQYLLQEPEPTFEEIGQGTVLTKLIEEIRRVPLPVNIARRY